MGHKRKITLTKTQKEEMVAAIKKYFFEERGQDLGDLAAGLILDFIVEKLAPEFYNQGVQDSHGYMSERIEEMLSIQR
jgi:uncharacterized protein (DUF2164 family)